MHVFVLIRDKSLLFDSVVELDPNPPKIGEQT